VTQRANRDGTRAALTAFARAPDTPGMRIGVPKEIKTLEFRVGMTPAGVAILTGRGHTVFVEKGAGLGSSLPDEAYVKAGATMVDTRDEVWGQADMVVKVKEPIAPEFPLMRNGQILFTYLHLAAAQELGKQLIERGVSGVAYETIEPSPGNLPLLTPMSAVAGRMSVQAGATFLERERGGKGILLGGVPGVRRGRVAILGGGVVGANAARIAVGLGAAVTVFDVNLKLLSYLDDVYLGRISTQYSDPFNVAAAVKDADLVIGGVLIPGARAPRLVTEEMVKTMEPGSVIVDVSIDQGGCVETARPTTHDNPTFVVHDVIHYGVANMPGAVPRTSTYALTNATIGYVTKLADLGLEGAIAADPHIVTGVNTYRGGVPHAHVAAALGVPHTPFKA
jgi:alanine dehydrogenase